MTVEQDVMLGEEEESDAVDADVERFLAAGRQTVIADDTDMNADASSPWGDLGGAEAGRRVGYMVIWTTLDGINWCLRPYARLARESLRRSVWLRAP